MTCSREDLERVTAFEFVNPARRWRVRVTPGARDDGGDGIDGTDGVRVDDVPRGRERRIDEPWRAVAVEDRLEGFDGVHRFCGYSGVASTADCSVRWGGTPRPGFAMVRFSRTHPEVQRGQRA